MVKVTFFLLCIWTSPLRIVWKWPWCGFKKIIIYNSFNIISLKEAEFFFAIDMFLKIACFHCLVAILNEITICEAKQNCTNLKLGWKFVNLKLKKMVSFPGKEIVAHVIWVNSLLLQKMTWITVYIIRVFILNLEKKTIKAESVQHFFTNSCELYYNNDIYIFDSVQITDCEVIEVNRYELWPNYTWIFYRKRKKDKKKRKKFRSTVTSMNLMTICARHIHDQFPCWKLRH